MSLKIWHQIICSINLVDVTPRLFYLHFVVTNYNHYDSINAIHFIFYTNELRSKVGNGLFSLRLLLILANLAASCHGSGAGTPLAVFL